MLKTNRGLGKFIGLSIITLGIYAIVVLSQISTEINTTAAKDGKRTMHYCLIFFIFSWLTLGIAPIVWIHRLSNRIGGQLTARELGFKFSASDFWLWNVLGSLIVVGPFVFYHKLLKAQNLVNADFNEKGC